MPDNIYKSELMRLEEITDEAPEVRTLRLKFLDKTLAENFTFNPGQFGLYGVFGEGECALCIASPPTRKGYFECTFRRVGKVTTALWDREVGEEIGFRGPYGNGFPIDKMEGKNLIFVAGGIGLFPLRSLIWYALDQRDRFGNITILYGSRSVADLVYKPELAQWESRGDVTLMKTIDPGGQTPDWDGKVGLVPTILSEVAPSSEDTLAFICGPPIMFKFTLPVLSELGFRDEDTFLTLENRMKCGVGKCGRCNIASVYICKEGPVFSAAEFKSFPEDM